MLSNAPGNDLRSSVKDELAETRGGGGGEPRSDASENSVFLAGPKVNDTAWYRLAFRPQSEHDFVRLVELDVSVNSIRCTVRSTSRCLVG